METSPLVKAASEGNQTELEQLIAARDTTLIDGEVEELLKRAANESQTTIMEYLLTRYSPQFTDTGIWAIIRSGSESIVSLAMSKDPTIIDYEVEIVGSLLSLACLYRHPLEFLKFLLDAGVDPAKETYLGVPPIALTARNYVDTEIIDLFMERGAKLEHSTALGLAAGQNNMVMVRYLLDKCGLTHESDLRMRLPKTAPALHAAAEKGHAEVLSVLLESGADVETKDYDGNTALDVAKAEGKKTGKDLTEVMNLLRSYSKRS